jgi:hypothetical protein
MELKFLLTPLGLAVVLVSLFGGYMIERIILRRRNRE